MNVSKSLIEACIVKIKKSAEAMLLLKGAEDAWKKKEFNFNKKRFYEGIKDLKKEMYYLIDCLKKNDIESMSKNLTEKEQNVLITKEEVAKKITNILKSHKDPYKKKLELFNLVMKLEVGEMEPSEERRTIVLLQGKVYNELAKQTLREYKKLTAKDYSKA